MNEIEALQIECLHITIKYTFDLAVRNVERQIVSRFVMAVHMFQPRYYQS